ncbi:hypothetical protein RJ55_06706 [Drechmeria coniospora]|nr:hypothetical protein RJ55_06706 [Drechmeria coniospora]
MDSVKWNPTVGQECHGLWLGYYVCVGVPGTPKERQTPSSPSSVQPSPVQPGIDGSCQKFYKADRGDTCLAIVDKHKTFTLEQFMNWNPSVQSDCSALWLGYYYCVAIPGTPTSAPPPAKQGPSPTQPGLDAKCDKYYQALPNDTCQGIVDKFHAFGLDAFYKWNPAVQNDCSGLWAGYHYCVNAP